MNDVNLKHSNFILTIHMIYHFGTELVSNGENTICKHTFAALFTRDPFLEGTSPNTPRQWLQNVGQGNLGFLRPILEDSQGQNHLENNIKTLLAFFILILLSVYSGIFQRLCDV